MIISKASLSRAPGTQGSLAKVLLAGAHGDLNHGLVWSLFSRADQEHRDFLFRQSDEGSFIIVSQREPEDPHGLWNVAPKPYEPELNPGDRLRFVLRANPAISVPQPGKARGLRADAIMHAKSKLDPAARKAFGTEDVARVGLDWLLKRGAAIGAAFDADTCCATGYQQVRIPRGKRQPAVEFSVIDYEGTLTVTDPDKLMVALFSGKGLGKAKAYGCGLMLIRRI